MNDYMNTQSNYDRGSYAYSTSSANGALSFSNVMTQVYLWMTVALMLTAGTAFLTVSSPTMLNFIYGNMPIIWGLFIAELVLVIALSAGINRLSPTTATVIFLLYSLITGITISSIFFAYSLGTITQAFAASALTFGAMTIFGFTVKKDLSGIGRILIMSLFGLIIGSVINFFWQNSLFDSLLTYAGIAIFIGLTATDTQKIKILAEKAEASGDPLAPRRVAILGALTLYLDFINLFLEILRMMGRKR